MDDIEVARASIKTDAQGVIELTETIFNRAYKLHVDTCNVLVRRALIDLGWTPPNDKHSVDCVGLALDLDDAAKVQTSQTAERAIKAAARALRIIAGQA